MGWKITLVLLSIMALRNVSSHVINASTKAPASTLPKCSDLADSEASFYYEGEDMETTCDWVALAFGSSEDLHWRCRTDNVKENCPIACEVPCERPSPTPSLSPSDVVPFCSDLADSEARFYVEGTQGNSMRTCDWVDRKDSKHWRCRTDNVKENCPIACEVPCKRPSPAPSLSPSDVVPFCSDLADSEARFYVEETQGNSMRTCKWPGERETKGRCSIPAVKNNCPITCNSVCRDESDAPSEAPSIQGPGISELNNSFPEKSGTSLAVKIGCSITGAIAAIIIITFLALRTEKKTVSYQVSEKIIHDDEDDDEEWFELPVASSKESNLMHSPVPQSKDSNSCHPTTASSYLYNSMYPPMESSNDSGSMYPPTASSSLHNSMYPPMESTNGSGSMYPPTASINHSTSSIQKSSSFIPADESNLGGKHSTKDVQCCDHFPCENCRAKNKVEFVPAKANLRKARKAGFDIANNGQRIEVISESMLLSSSGESEGTITL
jgi:hypothetical protein